MTVRPGVLIRATLALGLAVIAAAVFLVPPGSKSTATRPHAAAPPPERRTPEGLILVDAPHLLARVARSTAQGVVVNAWASWCGSCKGELPMLLALGKSFDPTSIEVLLVSVDDPEDRPAAAEMLAALGVKTTAYAVDGPIEVFKTQMNPRWPGMIPATFLFDRTPKLRYFWGGQVFENEIGPLLRRYLAGENIDGEANFALAPGAVTDEGRARAH